ncbi:Nitrile-specifier protein 5 [Thelohanellus kitauei]|uniref:Nitrile-specifier protein 5 n=1 Tax=Thelohanellus kitauei TaxID=669202 RepID=A0A0C2N3Q8_THEKT|nr:Nitrile-specifier protein 5 [Thelohanellus kitauei]
MSEGNEPTRPENRSHHCMTSIREHLFIYGGHEHHHGTECNELWSFNTKRGVWKRYQLPQEIDTPLSSSICSIGNLIYIFGGYRFDGDDYRQTNSLISFDITESTWEVLYPHTDDYDYNTPPPICGNLLCYHGGSLYILGGFYQCLTLDSIYKFSLKSAKWSMVPQNGVKPTFNRQIFGTIYKNR